MAISKGKETVKQPTGYVTLVSEGGTLAAPRTSALARPQILTFCRAGFRFNVPKEAAMLSSTLRDMLSGQYIDSCSHTFALTQRMPPHRRNWHAGSAIGRRATSGAFVGPQSLILPEPLADTVTTVVPRSSRSSASTCL